MGRFATLYITLVSVSIAVLTVMEGLPLIRAFEVACVACIFKAIASHIHHAVYDHFHPKAKAEKAKTEVAVIVGKIDYHPQPQPKDKQLPC